MCAFTWVIWVTRRQAGYRLGQSLRTSMSACMVGWGGGGHPLYLIYIDWPLACVHRPTHMRTKCPCVHKVEFSDMA